MRRSVTVLALGIGRDRIDCGPGFDVVHADEHDVHVNCELIRR